MIHLQAGGRRPGRIQFLIRSQPSAGHLGPIRQLADDQAVVTYYHDAESPLTSDSFRYAVQAIDSPVSASAEVSIQIIEPPPRPRLPETIDLGKVAIGGEVLVEVQIRNPGGPGVVTPEITGPFEIAPGGGVQLPAGRPASLQLSFRPHKAGKYNGQLRLKGVSGQASQIRAEAYSPIVTKPARIQLLASGKPPKRSADFVVENISDDYLEIDWEAPPGIVAPDPVVMAPGAFAPLHLVEDGSTPGGIEGDLIADTRAFHISIPLSALPLPAELSVQPGEIELVRDESGALAGHLTISNSGGMAASFAATLPGEFVLSPPAANTVIPAGSAQDFTVKLREGESVPADSTAIIRSGRQVIEIPVLTGQVESTEPGGPEMRDFPPARSDSAASGGGQTSADTPESKQAPALPTPPPFLPTGLRLASVAEDRVSLTWDDPDWPLEDVVIQCRQIDPAKDGQEAIQWVPWPSTAMSESSGKPLATILQLPRNSVWSMRLAIKRSDGQLTPMDGLIRIQTAPPPSTPWVAIFISAATLTLIGGAGALYLRKRRRSTLR